MNNLNDIEQYLIKTIREAGEILKKHFSTTGLQEYQKEGVDFTTEADREVDQFLQDRLREHFPQSNFLTEETAPDDYSLLSNSENIWIIDPLDGTINFSRKHPNFAISVALMHKGKVKIGAVYLPLLDKLYLAREDKDGAYLNNIKISISHTSSLRESVIACDWAWDLDKRKNVIKWLDKLSGDIRQIKSMGSAAADIASLADGKIDAYIHSGLKPWDVAAAGFIAEKAGGSMTLPDGSEWSPFNPDILLTNKNLHNDILSLVKS